MVALVFGRKTGSGPTRPPRRPCPPCTEQQIGHAQHRLRLTLQKQSELLHMFHEIFAVVRPESDDGRDMAYAHALVDLFTGEWRNDKTLAQVLAGWPSLPIVVKDALRTLSDPNHDEYTYPAAIEILASTLPPEQIAELAGRLQHRLAQATSSDRARTRAIVDALQYMDRAQLAALAPVVTAMIDATPRRTTRIRAAVRGLLQHLFTLDDWMALAVSAVRRIRRGDR